MKNFLCLFLVVSLLAGAESNAAGAPNTACPAVSPNQAAHLGAAPQGTPVPYMVSGLPSGNYTPGMEYTLTVTGMNSEMFRGFLGVSLNAANARVGSFTPMANGQLTCDDNRGITHTNNINKASLSFIWTAPPEETGEVQFQFAVVMVRDTYWANQNAATLQEGQPLPEPSSTSSATASPSASSVADGGTSSTASSSPSSTATPGDGGNSAPSNVAGSLATILLAVAALVMVAVFV